MPVAGESLFGNLTEEPGLGDSISKEALRAFLGIASTGLAIQVITESGTYEPTAGMVQALVIATGGGGGGGGADTGGSGDT